MKELEKNEQGYVRVTMKGDRTSMPTHPVVGPWPIDGTGEGAKPAKETWWPEDQFTFRRRREGVISFDNDAEMAKALETAQSEAKEARETQAKAAEEPRAPARESARK